MDYLRLLLLPFSLLYGIAVWLRNRFYDWGWMKQTAFAVPTIVVGNLAVGGTGKTPMTEYLVRLLAPNYRVATLSRGYGRTTRGFRVVEFHDTAEESGDEPLQFKRKFPEVMVTVCEDRVIGVQWLVEHGYEVIVLDDAFQHRALKPGLSLLLFDYPSIRRTKWLLPAGNYRDWLAERKRADVMVVTKTPDIATTEDREAIRRRLAGDKQLPVLFAGIGYGKLTTVWPDKSDTTAEFAPDFSILLVTGIANPDPLHSYLAARAGEIFHLRYPDHHAYTAADMEKIKRQFVEIGNARKRIITTEKDLQRLLTPERAAVLRGLPVYVLPMHLTLGVEDEEMLQQTVLQYCADRYRRDSS